MILEGLSVDDARFRAEVLEFLRAELTAEIVAAADAHESLFPPPSVTLPWQAKLRKRGWLGLHWPRESGGAGLGAMQRFILETEALQAGAPQLAPFGLNYLGPILVRFGTEAQRARFLPRILSGEDYWCQGYSEPNAGSDLVSLQCAARREGAEYLVRGTKLWTTHAQHANWIFLLVRTSNEGKPHSGISFLLVNLRSPGVSVTPIHSIAGEHETNQVFFDEVRVPAEQLVGGEGEGWAIARYLLEFERGGFVMNGLLRRKLARCEQLLPPALADATALEAAALRARFVELQTDLLALAAAELRVALSFEVGHSPGPEAMVLKVEFTELMQRIESLGVALLGSRALGFTAGHGAGNHDAGDHDAGDHDASHRDSDATTRRDPVAQALLGSYLNNRAATIYGGSSEIQRDILARTIVGK